MIEQLILNLSNMALKKVKYCILIVLFSSLSYAEPVKIELITEEFPPLHVQVDGNPKGYVVDFVKKLVDDANKEVPMAIDAVHFVPWKRAMRMSKNRANSLFFSISRTPAREEQYHWIGKVSPYEVMLYKHVSGPKNTPAHLEELKDYKIGCQAGSSFEEYVSDKGLNLKTVTYGRRAIKLLRAKRIDFAPLVSSSYFYRIEQYGFNPNEFLPVIRIDDLSKDLWLVTSIMTSPKVVEALKNSYQQLKEQGTLQKLITDYQPYSEVMIEYRDQKQQELLKLSH